MYSVKSWPPISTRTGRASGFNGYIEGMVLRAISVNCIAEYKAAKASLQGFMTERMFYWR